MFADSLVAIDMHVHLADERALSFKRRRVSQMAAHFGHSADAVPIDELADKYRERNMMAIVMNSTDRTITGDDSLPNDYIAEVVAQHPDVFLGFGVVDPWEGARAVREIERCRTELGLIGVGELNPARQHFYPDDPRFEQVWSAASDLGMVVLFHGGYAAAGSGTPGGSGVKLRYSRPIHLDGVAADHPDLQIVCAHPSWPWTSEALAVAQHKSNVYLDLSGWAPKYFSDELKTYVRSRITDKVLFGSDWPGIEPDRWLREFDELEFNDDVRHKVLLQNAKTMFGAARRRDEESQT